MRHYDSTGECYEHRRQWAEERLLELADIFSLEVCAYAVMSNHCHIVLHIHSEQTEAWSDLEVIDRWHRLYKGNFLSQRLVRRQHLSAPEQATPSKCVENWRSRLCSISQFMQILNEGIARQANAEDNCAGRFWEGRYKPQALLDEATLAACMAYVDLNPIRAGMADSPEGSDHTSIKRRVSDTQVNSSNPLLMPFAGNPKVPMPFGLPFREEDYFELVGS